jgi:hypothetical protein
LEEKGRKNENNTRRRRKRKIDEKEKSYSGFKCGLSLGLR